MDPSLLGSSRNPFSVAVDILSAHVVSSPRERSLSRLEQAISATFEWSKKLAALSEVPGQATLEAICTFSSAKLLDFVVDSANCFAPSSPFSTNRDPNPPHGPQPRPSTEGEKVAALVHVLKALLTSLNERAKSEGEWWYDMGNALNKGLVNHLDENDVGNKTPQDLAYRTFLCIALAEPLVRVVVPDPKELPKSSADELEGLGKNPKEMAVKYSALEVLGDLLSKNERNKAVLGKLLPPEYLGAILHAGWDYHLSHLTFELAFRLLPTKQFADRRRDFLERLFSEDTFGRGKDDLAKSLQRKMDRLNVSKGWDEGYQAILKRISELHIRRSQFFEVVSMTYDSQQLLVPTDRGAESISTLPTPSLQSILAENYYESKLVWFSRHILAANVTVRSDEDNEETEERMIVPLEGVERIFVQNLERNADGVEMDPNFHCLKITMLIDPTRPLTIADKPLPSSPSHIGPLRESEAPSQAEEYVAAGSGLKVYHEWVLLVKKSGEIARILHETLLERGKKYPHLLSEISDFSNLASRPYDSIRQKPSVPIQTQALRATVAANTTATDQAARAAIEEEAQERRATFAAPTTTAEQAAVPKQKSSETQEELESQFSSSRGGATARMQHEISKSSTSKANNKPDSSQGETQKRRVEVATMADVEVEEVRGQQAMEDGSGAPNPLQQNEPVEAEQKHDSASRRERGATPEPQAESKLPEEPKETDKKRQVASLGNQSTAGPSSAHSGEDKRKKDEHQMELEGDVGEVVTGKVEKGGRAEAGKPREDQELPPPSKPVTSKYSRRSKDSVRKGSGDKEVSRAGARPGTAQDKDKGKPRMSEEKSSVRSTRVRQRSQPPDTPGIHSGSTSLRSAPRKIVAAPPDKASRKRGRAQRDEGDEPDEESEEGQSSGEDAAEIDLPEPETLGQGRKQTAKKVVGTSTKLDKTKPATTKRRKVSGPPPQREADQGEDTDYDEPVNVVPKKIVMSASKKYGKEKKSPAKGNGKVRKAAKGSTGGRGSKAPQVVVEVDAGKQTKPIRARPPRAAPHREHSGLGSTRKKAEESEPDEQEQEKGNTSARSSRVDKPETTQERRSKIVVARHSTPSVHEEVEQQAQRKRSNSIAPNRTPSPFDVEPSKLHAIKARAPPSMSETTSNQPRKSFHELISERPSHRDDLSAEAEEMDLGGFDAGNFDEEHVRDGHIDDSRVTRSISPLLAPIPQGRSAEIRPSSPLPEPIPARDESTSIDQSVSRKDEEATADTAPAPRVIVPATPTSDLEKRQPTLQGKLALGHHFIEPLHKESGADVGGTNIGIRPDGSQADLEEAEEWRSFEGDAEAISHAHQVGDDSGVWLSPAHPEVSKLVSKQCAPETANVSGLLQRTQKAPLLAHPQTQFHQQAQSQFVRHLQARPTNYRAQGLPVAPLEGTTAETKQVRYAVPSGTKPSGYTPRLPRMVREQEYQPTGPEQITRLRPLSKSSRISSTSVPRSGLFPLEPKPQWRAKPIDAAPRVSKLPPAAGSSGYRQQPRNHHPAASVAHRDFAGHRMTTDEGDNGGQEAEGSDFEQDEEMLYDSFLGFADLMTRKHRERRMQRERHTEEARQRVEAPLVKYMIAITEENAKLVAKACARSVTATDPLSPNAGNPDSSLFGAARAAIHSCDTLWQELQAQLAETGTVRPDSDIVDAGGSGGGAGVAGQ